MKLYYAHSVGIYDSPQEERDIIQLLTMGFEVYDPNNQEVKEDIEMYRKIHGEEKVMDYFNSLLDQCDGLAFRAHADGKIGSGVWYEIQYIKAQNKPIIELPSLITNRALSVEDTKEYLRLHGNR